jgi:anthranilate synthase/aminodeoxychorismate synthase-like glutamine amidotransferase
MWVLIDNYDSFTYILHHYLLQTGHDCMVVRNDALTVSKLAALTPSRLIISPGPGRPSEAGIVPEAIRYFHESIPILGICLGHQALGECFGAELVHAARPMHGKTSLVRHNGHPLFAELPETFEAMRYHSLTLRALEGTGLEPLAFSEDDGAVMAMVHERYPCTGIQFHPESVGTPGGMQLIRNWAKQPVFNRHPLHQP